MCDPSALTGAMGAGTKVMDAMGRQKAAAKQDRANKDHAMFQLALMNQHLQRQGQLRGQGEAAWGAALDDMSAGTQIARQSQEEARLASYLNGDSPSIMGAKDPASMGNQWWNMQPVNGGGSSLASYSNAPTTDKTVVAPPSNQGSFSFDPGIAGSQQGGEVFQQDLARKLNQAAVGARSQINALARVNSYGNSYGGLGTVNPLILGNSASAIDFYNNFRRGDLSVYNVEKQIPGAQYTYKQSPAAGLGGALGGGMKSMGSMFGGGMGF
jgi:hypothetical protein